MLYPFIFNPTTDTALPEPRIHISESNTCSHKKRKEKTCYLYGFILDIQQRNRCGHILEQNLKQDSVRWLESSRQLDLISHTETLVQWALESFENRLDTSHKAASCTRVPTALHTRKRDLRTTSTCKDASHTSFSPQSSAPTGLDGAHTPRRAGGSGGCTARRKERDANIVGSSPGRQRPAATGPPRRLTSQDRRQRASWGPIARFYSVEFAVRRFWPAAAKPALLIGPCEMIWQGRRLKGLSRNYVNCETRGG